MSKLKCIIIEDEPLAVRVLSDYISQIPFIELKKTFKDAISATEYLRNNNIDLIFLDLHLPKLKGMQFLKTLPQCPAVIITTAYHQYAVEGFDQNVTDYLLKPFDFERFLVAVNKVKKNSGEKNFSAEADEKDFIILNVQKKKVRIAFQDIVYIESQKEYVKIVTTKKEYLSKLSTQAIEQMLPTQHFKRIHRSFIIAMDKLESFNAEEAEVNGVTIPIGRGYREVFEKM